MLGQNQLISRLHETPQPYPERVASFLLTNGVRTLLVLISSYTVALLN